ncbi:MAG: sialate O-acetylesterase [Lachnospiraceae bacterium]|nr:sialate O-acetylesterase [Lachnospiraceae bacterium]
MIKLPDIFKEHMVFQRRKNICVWGKTNKKYVRVELNDKTVQTKVENGSFEAYIPSMEAGGPYILKVVAGDNLVNDNIIDVESIIIGDVMVGEVWIACGQSNMEFELQNSYDGQARLKKINNPKVRYYYTPKFAYEGEELDKLREEAHWGIATEPYANADEIGKLSAVGYYFASMLSQNLGVTVAIINCNWGGTHAYCWMGREALLSNSKIAHYMKDYDELVSKQDPAEYDKEYADYVVYQAEFDRKCGDYYMTHEHPSWEECIELCGENKYPGPVGPKAFVRPTGLYDVMLKPMVPYTIAGFIYYQGEDDDQAPESYYELMVALINQWREDFKNDKLPVLITQLPMFMNECDTDFKNWPLMREAQQRVADTMKNVSIGVITDKGDLNNIHPIHKKPVGERLALKALADVYKVLEPELANGPTFKSYYVEKSSMVLKFDFAENGIIAHTPAENALLALDSAYVDLSDMATVIDNEKSKAIIDSYKGYSGYINEEDDYVKSFEIAGEDKIYHKADKCIIEDNIVRISSEKVKNPRYARYNWTNYSKVMLYGDNGLPVAPFRTCREDGSDNWKSDEEKKEMRFGQAI